MPKQYKEIKLFNGMAMSYDANDIGEDTTQILVNTKDLANGKIESEKAPVSTTLNTATVTSVKIKTMNDLTQIVNNSDTSVIIANVMDTNDLNNIVSTSVSNNNVNNIATSLIASDSFSNSAKFAKFGKQLRIVDKTGVPKFIGYVNQQNKTSLVTAQNSNTIIYESDNLLGINASSTKGVACVTSSINTDITWFVQEGKRTLSVVTSSTVGDIVEKTIVESEEFFTDENYEFAYITEDKEASTSNNKKLYLIAKQKVIPTNQDLAVSISNMTTFKIFCIKQKDMITATSFSEAVRYVVKNGYIDKECNIAIQQSNHTLIDGTNLSYLMYDLADIKVTKDYIFISLCNKKQNTEPSSIWELSENYGFNYSIDKKNNSYQSDILYRIPKSFTNLLDYYLANFSLVRSNLPFVPIPYSGTLTENDIFFNSRNMIETSINNPCRGYLSLGEKSLSQNITIEKLRDSIKSYFVTNRNTLATGIANNTTYYYYYPVPDTAIFRGLGRYAGTGYNNLTILDYTTNIVGLIMSGCINGSLLETHEYNSNNGTWSTNPPSSYTPGFKSNGWICFKVVKNGTGDVFVTLVESPLRSVYDTVAPTTDIDTASNYNLRHANHYMLVWNGFDDISPTIPRIPTPITLPKLQRFSDGALYPTGSTTLISQLTYEVTPLNLWHFRHFRNDLSTGGVLRALVVFESDAENKDYINCLAPIKKTQLLNFGGSQYRSIISIGKRWKCSYPSNAITSKTELSATSTLEKLSDNDGYALPLSYASYNDGTGGTSENRTEQSLITLLMSGGGNYIFNRPYQYDNLESTTFILPNNYSGTDFVIKSDVPYLVTMSNVPLLQEVSVDQKVNTYNSIPYVYQYPTGLSNYVSLFTSSFLQFFFTGIIAGEEDANVYEKGYTYSFKTSFLYDGYQESTLSPIIYSVLCEDNYKEAELSIKLYTDFFTQTSKRITAINLYIAKYSGDTQIELYRLVKVFNLNTQDFKLSTIEAFYTDKGNRLASYEAITGLSEQTTFISLKYNVYHSYNNTLFIGDISHALESINHSKYLLTKSMPGKFSIFDYANNFAILPFIPKVITDFNYKIYAFGDSGYAIVNPDTLSLEFESNNMSCSIPDYVCSTQYGLFIYRNNRVYSINGASVDCVSIPIERADNVNYSGLSNVTVSKLYFDNNINSLVLLGKYTATVGSYAQANKPVLFVLSFDSKSWRVLTPVLPISSDTGLNLCSEYNINGYQYLWHYDGTNSKSIKLASDSTLSDSLYVSKKLIVDSEFLKQFLYLVKLNFKSLGRDTVISIFGYANNHLTYTVSFNTYETTLTEFKEISNSSNQATKINYIMLEVYGKFEDVQSIGLLVRGLIR